LALHRRQVVSRLLKHLRHLLLAFAECVVPPCEHGHLLLDLAPCGQAGSLGCRVLLLRHVPLRLVQPQPHPVGLVHHVLLQ
jgi:hypothetical protein